MDIRYLHPFYSDGKMFRESVIFWEENGECTASLRFVPQKIRECLTSSLLQSFTEGIDYVAEGNVLRAVSQKIPRICPEEYLGTAFPPDENQGLLRFSIAKPYYSEDFFIKRQVVVSYDYDNISQPFDTNGLTFGSLPRTLSKLNNKKLDIVLYGDSISVGATSSAFINLPPYLPTFFDMLTGELRRKYGADIIQSNASQGGMASAWAVENMQERLKKDADLYIFAWGMNDGTGGVTTQHYLENIKRLIDYTDNGKAEYILIAPMFPNPDAENIHGRKFLGNQEKYLNCLLKLAKEGIAVCNMTDFHKRLLVNKKYCDMTGNNINHPNDFLARMYAVNLLNHF